MTDQPSTHLGSVSETVYFEDGEQVYPCRCGETHRGPYGVYEYGHHNCTHFAGLWVCPEGFALCRACGESFDLTNL